MTEYKNLIKILFLALIMALSACGPDYVRFTGVGCVKDDGSVGKAYTDGSCR